MKAKIFFSVMGIICFFLIGWFSGYIRYEFQGAKTFYSHNVYSVGFGILSFLFLSIALILLLKSYFKDNSSSDKQSEPYPLAKEDFDT